MFVIQTSKILWYDLSYLGVSAILVIALLTRNKIAYMHYQFQLMKTSSVGSLKQNLKYLDELEPIPSSPQSLTTADWVMLVKSRDDYIKKLAQSIQQFEDNLIKRELELKDKIEEEIAQNEKAVKAFADVTENIIGMIAKISKVCSSQKSSVKSSGDYRQSIAHSLKQSKSDKEEQIQQQSQFSCIDEIVQQTDKLLSYLSSLIQELIQYKLNSKQDLNQRGIKSSRGIEETKSGQTIKSKETGTQTNSYFFKCKHQQTQTFSLEKIKQVQGQRIKTIKDKDDEIQSLKAELNQKVIQYSDLKILLEQQQQTKNKILFNIYNTIPQDMLKEIEKMNRQQLIEQIKKRHYRVKQLEKDKRELLTRSKLEREIDQQKFMELLQQIKRVKKMHLSMSLS